MGRWSRDSTQLAAALAALLAAGCSCSEPTGVGEACTTSGDCDPGLRCVDGACETARASDGGDSGGGAFDSGGGGDAGDRADASDRDSGDASCGGEAVPIDYRAPNILVVFDRSCSMRRRLDDTDLFGTGPDDVRTRWNVAREAIRTITTRYDTRIFWGLMAFPDPREGCDERVTAEVLPAPGNADAIYAELMRSEIQPFGLCGLDNTDTTTQPRQTPTFDALTDTRDLAELNTTERASFAIVVTDGGVSCGVTDGELSTLAAELLSMGIPTGVIGFSTGASVGSLEAIAAAGGLARPGGSPSYYVADDAADLDAVLDEITARVVSCDLPLASTPPAGEGIFVYANDTELPEDATDGWTYDAGSNLVTLNGASCDRLRSGDITRLQVAFGCAPVACVPMPETCNGLDDDCNDLVDDGCLM